MTPARTAEEFVAAISGVIRRVPQLHEGVSCPFCLGPKDLSPSGPECTGCRRRLAAVPGPLRRMVVPLTVGVMGSPWYSRARRYKEPPPDQTSQLELAAVLHLFTRENADRFAGMLGGPIDLVTVVPSTRVPPPVPHPLRLVVRQSSRLLAMHADVLTAQAVTGAAPHFYNPQRFRLADDAPRLAGRRVLLVEDTWFTGSCAMSAAAVLAAAGASVVVAPIIRAYDPAFTADNHPYLRHAGTHWYASRWPRAESVLDDLMGL